MKRVTLLACVLVACSPSPEAPMRPACTNGGFFVGPVGNSSPYQPRAETLTIRMRHPVQCPEGFEATATVAVLDPNNDEVPVIGGGPKRLASTFGDLETAIEFRPTLLGTYHLTARFDPNLGVSQTDIFVGEDHRRDEPELDLPRTGVVAGCWVLDVTALGRPFCILPKPQLLDRAGHLVQSLDSAQRVARWGEVLWSLEANGVVIRHQEQASGFVPTFDGGVALPSDGGFSGVVTPAMAADSEGLLLAERGEIHHVSHDGAVISRKVEALDPKLQVVALWKTGERFILLAQGTEEAPPRTQAICSGTIRGEAKCTLDPASFDTALAANADGLWWSNNISARATVSNDLISAHFPVTSFESRQLEYGRTLPWGLGAFFRESEQGPVMMTTSTNRGIVTQLFPDLGVLSVTYEWVTLLARENNRVWVYRRRAPVVEP